jgi:hypothetical protein
MYFYYQQNILPNTLSGSDTKTDIKLPKGLLDFIDVGIPSGVNRLAKCKIFYNEFQIVPFNRDNYFTGNDITVRIPIKINIEMEMANLSILCINLDDTYNHELSFGIYIDEGKPMSSQDIININSLLHVTEG